MSLTSKTITSKEIIANVLRDNLYKAQDIEVSALIEWVSEVLDLTGVPLILKDMIDCIKIEDHRGNLPCDLHSVNQMSGLTDGGVQFPMREATGTFHPLFLNNVNGQPFINTTQPISYDADGNPIFNFNMDNQTLPENTVNTKPYTYQDVTYKLNNNHIFTSFPTGRVLMSYRAYPVDKEGYPLIPDNIKFKQAVQAYLRFKLDYRLWRKGELLREVFEHSEREYMWYVGAATVAGLMPSLDKMESWKNQMTSLIPRYSEHGRFYESLGNQEFMTSGNKLRKY
ncbi:MAG: hypothetical protein E6R13_01655 [Spirochaetes bacterium]|nr:MAG: hypothetical protein E6R13_01655 [Spirochaetota bacterium]